MQRTRRIIVMVLLVALGSLTLPASAVAESPPRNGGGGWTDYPNPNAGSARPGQADNGEIPLSETDPLTLAKLGAAFSNARAVENADLCPGGVCEPGATVMPTAITFPANFMNRTPSERALWLVNSERVARGLLPFVDVDPGVEALAQGWADERAGLNGLLHNDDTVGDFEAVCNGCIGNYETGQFADGIAENLYRRNVTGGNTEAVPPPSADQFAVELAVYVWMYYDLDQEGEAPPSQEWGHRHALLWNNLIDDHGQTGSEGYIGIGYSKVDTEGELEFNGVLYQTLNENELVVMNMIDSRDAFPVQANVGYPVGSDVGVARTAGGSYSVDVPAELLTCLADRSLTVTAGALVLYSAQEDANMVADLSGALTDAALPVGTILTFDRPGCARGPFDVTITADGSNKRIPVTPSRAGTVPTQAILALVGLGGTAVAFGAAKRRSAAKR